MIYHFITIYHHETDCLTFIHPIWSPWNELVLHRDTQLIGLSPCVSVRCRRRWNRHLANGFWTVGGIPTEWTGNHPSSYMYIACVYIYIYIKVEIRYLIIAAYVYIYIYLNQYIYIYIYIHRYYCTSVSFLQHLDSPSSARLRLSCRDWNWPCCRRDCAWKWRIRADGLWLGGVLTMDLDEKYVPWISKINLVTVYYIYINYMSRIYVCIYKHM